MARLTGIILLVLLLLIVPALGQKQAELGTSIQNLKDNDGFVRWDAAHTLGNIRDSKAIDSLGLALNNNDTLVRWEAKSALTNIKSTQDGHGTLIHNKNIIPGDFNPSLNYDFTEIDQHALSTPENEKRSIESLATYLTKPAKNDMEKARAIYRWVAENIDYNVQGLFEDNYGDVSAEGVLKSGRSVCSGYSNLFERLANASGLEAVTISGYAKGYSYTPGMRFSGQTDHTWNAVKIDGKWYLIDSTWGAGVVGADKKYHREFDDYYFLTPPKEFIYRHFPEDSMWQLLEKPISKKEFEDLVYLEPAFTKLGIGIGNQKNITIISNGQANITLYSPKNVSLMC